MRSIIFYPPPPLPNNLYAKFSVLSINVLTALALCSSDNSLAASPIDDNSTNPPSISMVGAVATTLFS